MKKNIITILTSFMLIVTLVLPSCSVKLPDETLPSETFSTTIVVEKPEETEITEESTEVTTEQTQPSHGPNSTAVILDKAIELNGQLSVDGTNLVNQNGEPVQLKGMSTYELQACPGFINEDVVQTLAEDWGCSVIRLAMYTNPSNSGYITHEERDFEEMCRDIDIVLAQGCYVIVDWHILFDGDPNTYKDEAIDFFSRISAIYGDEPGIIYEICNEPNGSRFDDDSLPVDWDCIRSYAVDVIDAIRANDPDNIIIVGTPTWSQDVDLASVDPLEDDNLMYTVHFYAGSHGQEKRDKIQTALDNGIAVFCTEWGTSRDTGGGGVFPEESMEWLTFFDEHNISWCNWSIGGAAAESSNALKAASTILTVPERLEGHWCDEYLSSSGYFVRCMLLGQEYNPED